MSKKSYKEVTFDKLDSMIGYFAVLNREGKMIPGKLLSVDYKEERAVFELFGGPDKGRKLSTRFSLKQKAHFYDFDHFNVMALSEISG